jgi:hypothetical protein
VNATVLWSVPDLAGVRDAAATVARNDVVDLGQIKQGKLVT